MKVNTSEIWANRKDYHSNQNVATLTTFMGEAPTSFRTSTVTTITQTWVLGSIFVCDQQLWFLTHWLFRKFISRRRFNAKFRAPTASIDRGEAFQISPSYSDCSHHNLLNNCPTLPTQRMGNQINFVRDSCSEYESAIYTDKENLDPSKFVS